MGSLSIAGGGRSRPTPAELKSVPAVRSRNTLVLATLGSTLATARVYPCYEQCALVSLPLAKTFGSAVLPEVNSHV